ncbi:chemotaxis protein CheW [Gemmatimonas sp. UBA7669]|uniref:chemotaxis protein CheW n=1 Tax=Gemmatimonas sp. UBA7669 TaxID=1946568 RepID=UPI0025C70E84|nr:chemotaxis protein CheW [Gemmatimonas sp. UBA7669]
MSQVETHGAVATSADSRPSQTSTPFRTAVGNARRRRTPDVERSTFVICRVENVLLAFPVEQVERVVPRQQTSTHAAAAHMPTLTLPERRATAHEVCALHPHAQALPRTLVLRHGAARMLLDVSHVYEVRAIETARVAGAGDDAPWAFVVGQFPRDDEPCWVLDVPRLLRAAETAHA